MVSDGEVCCDHCMDGSSGPAVVFCCSCRQFLCNFCHKHHKRGRQLSKHSMVGLDQEGAKQLQTTMKPREQHCLLLNHEDNKLKCYCKTCKSISCLACAIVSHKSHDVTELSTVAKVHREEITGWKEKKEALLAELEEISLSKTTALTIQKEEFEKMVKEIGRYTKVASDILQTHTDHEIVALDGLVPTQLHATVKKGPDHTPHSKPTHDVVDVSPSSSTWTSTSVAKAKTGYQLKVESNTSQRKRYPFGGVKVKAEMRPKGDFKGEVVYGEVEDHRDGTYTITLTPQTAGPHQLLITMDGQHVQNSPCEMDVMDNVIKENTAQEFSLFDTAQEFSLFDTAQEFSLFDTAQEFSTAPKTGLATSGYKKEWLTKVFLKLHYAGLKVKMEKCNFAQKAVKYLGHVVSAEAISLGSAETEVVTSYSVPTSPKEVKQFIDLYRRFVKDYSKVAAPLSKAMLNLSPGTQQDNTVGAIEELILDGTLHSFLKAQEKDPELSKVTEAMTKWDHHFTNWDIMAPLLLSTRGHKYILVITDLFNKKLFYWLADSDTLASVLIDEVVCRYDVPRSLHSDQGANLNSMQVALCKRLGINKTRITAYHPQGNEQVQQFNRTLEAILSNVVVENIGIGIVTSQRHCSRTE
ncbi:hypothetical protein EMCRGX_G025937 [Ephydatia muelleri]